MDKKLLEEMQQLTAGLDGLDGETGDGEGKLDISSLQEKFAMIQKMLTGNRKEFPENLKKCEDKFQQVKDIEDDCGKMVQSMENDLEMCIKGDFQNYEIYSKKERKDFKNFDYSKFKRNKEDFKSFQKQLNGLEGLKKRLEHFPEGMAAKKHQKLIENLIEIEQNHLQDILFLIYNDNTNKQLI